MSFKLGITGFIGMGKTTVSTVFSEHNIPVWNADESVHKLYEYNQLGYKALISKYPQLNNCSGIDRTQLSEMIRKKEVTLKSIELIIHPLLTLERQKFINKHRKEPIVIFDIPLLYETKAEGWLNAVLLVFCSKKTQIERLLKRKNMTKEKIEMLIIRQEKNRGNKQKPQFIIDTNKKFADVKKDVKKIIETIKDNLDEKRNSS